MVAKDFKVVILCGGLGSRLAEETRSIPKPMVRIGKLPIINQIIKQNRLTDFELVRLVNSVRQIELNS